MVTVRSFLPTDRFGAATYLVAGEESAAIVDPSVLPEAVLSACGGTIPKVRAILLTHAHFDHMLALSQWCDATGAPVYVGAADAEALSDPQKNAYLLFTGERLGYAGDHHAVNDGDEIACGELAFRVLETPGHTRGSVTYLTDRIAFTGDLIFEGGGYGRTDLYGGDLRALYASLRRLAAHRETETLYPGHGAPVPHRLLAEKF